MENNLKFNSAICTSRSQSERLLALGIKPETADMSLCYMTHDIYGKEMEPRFLGCIADPMQCEEMQTILFSRQKFYPAWSLHRLIELAYGNWKEEIVPVYLGNSYDMLIGRIEFQVKQGKFNKEYLI